MNFTYCISVVEVATGEIVKQSTVTGISKAMKVARGIEINLSEKFRVEVVKL